MHGLIGGKYTILNQVGNDDATISLIPHKVQWHLSTQSFLDEDAKQKWP